MKRIFGGAAMSLAIANSVLGLAGCGGGSGELRPLQEHLYRHLHLHLRPRRRHL